MNCLFVISVDKLKRPQLYIDDERKPGILFLAVKQAEETYIADVPIKMVKKQYI